MHDERQPLVGQWVLLQAPRLETGVMPEHYEVAEMRGLTAVLRPGGSAPAPVMRPGTPVVVTFGYPDYPRRLEGIILEGPWDGDVTLVRLPKLPEQRAHPRYGESLGVELQVIGERAEIGEPNRAEAVDVSAGGIRLRSPIPFVAGQRSFITIQLPEGMPVIAIGEAVVDSIVAGEADRVHETHKTHETRLKFTTMSDEDKGRLVRHLTQGTPPPAARVSDPVENRHLEAYAELPEVEHAR